MALLDTYYHALGAIVPRTPMVRSRLLNDVLHGWPYHRVRKPRLGLFTTDPLLGWAHRPDVRTVHPSFEFRVRYTIDANGCRDSGNATSAADVVILGCSWAFGHGVDDRDTVAARLATTGPTVRNHACMGYGPAHAYLQLRHRITLTAETSPNASVFYLWSPDQLMRAWRRREWVLLNAWVNPTGSSHPVFDLDPTTEHGLRHVGLIGPDDAVSDDPLLPQLVERTEWLVTVRLLAAMRDLVERDGRKYAVVIPPVPAQAGVALLADALADRVNNERIPMIDLRRTPEPVGRFFYRFDGHPTPAWHAHMADVLATHAQRA